MSNIEWTDTTWNPLAGCTPVSPGCLNCYAATMARRLEAMGRTGYEPRQVPETRLLAQIQRQERVGYVEACRMREAGKTVRIAEVCGGRAVFTGDVRLLPDRLTEPLKWRKPRRVFVNSMSDLFHGAVPDSFIRMVFAVMSYAGQHTFQVLTKRPERMAVFFSDDENNSLSSCQAEYCVHGTDPVTPTGRSRIRDTRSINGTRRGLGDGNYWPLPNVWLGASVEDQARADERIPHLLKCPAAVRFLSCEPLLGPIDLSAFFGGQYVGLPGDVVHPNYNFGIGWVIVGGESGPNARTCDVEWIRSIVRQCKAAAVPCFVKQLGSSPMLGDVSEPHGWPVKYGPVDWETGRIHLRDRKGGDPAEWPADLLVREMPERTTTWEK